MKRLCIAVTAVLMLANTGHAQYGRSRPESEAERKAREELQRKKAEKEAEQDLQKRLISRDKALEKLGPGAKGFIREYGDLGVKAILICSPETGKELVDLHDAGRLSGLPDPKAALAGATDCGAVGLAWLAKHWQELGDADATQAFVREPAEFVHGFKDLQKYARVVRHQREDSGLPFSTDAIVERAGKIKWQGWAIIGGVGLAVVWLIRRPKQWQGRTP
jgi:hypothetical protein